MIKGAIFDADGTLFDSMSIWNEAGERFLKNNDIEADATINNELEGMNLTEAAEYLKKKYSLKDSVQKIVDEICGVTEDFYFNEITLKEGVLQFLTYLKKKGVKMCIATSSEKYLIDAAIKKTGLENIFEFIITSNEVGCGKSKPVIYFSALEKLGTNVDSTVVFEDVAHAALTAKSAGFTVCGIYDRFEKNFPVDKVDFYIESFEKASDLF